VQPRRCCPAAPCAQPGPRSRTWALHSLNQVLLHILALRISEQDTNSPYDPCRSTSALPHTGQSSPSAPARSASAAASSSACESSCKAGLRYTRTRHVRPKQPAFQHHHPAAVIAVFFLLARFLPFGCIQIRLAAVFSLVKSQLTCSTNIFLPFAADSSAAPHRCNQFFCVRHPLREHARVPILARTVIGNPATS